MIHRKATKVQVLNHVERAQEKFTEGFQKVIEFVKESQVKILMELEKRDEAIKQAHARLDELAKAHNELSKANNHNAKIFAGRIAELGIQLFSMRAFLERLYLRFDLAEGAHERFQTLLEEAFNETKIQLEKAAEEAARAEERKQEEASLLPREFGGNGGSEVVTAGPEEVPPPVFEQIP
jgi:hypothetical protein